ncbi:vacuolar protein sorting/targeting protein PEP1 [Neophaeococcomyces mojaviensis]|uniref:Vacuolar protein sorting/targeting protein PEP1 n=1 Tax=Neophaeococcomyces mojaviensis TaxID=3383035 RepID=A0ACC2ZTC9_9EURO|nr:vacuolar protein sorting/targeting protein PEP1 [Knufia sp. JES_112]
MILRNLLASTLAIFSLSSTVLSKKDSPTITSTKFDNPLRNVFYFDDSNVILGHDDVTGDVYRSDDAGSTWSLVNDNDQSGESFDVYPHPWDNQRAYILGFGRTHWVTTNQGKSWRKWDSGGATLRLNGAPFSFHGRDPTRVIWNGQDCIGGVFEICSPVTYYTDDDFVHVSTLTKDVPGGCIWAVGTPMFGEDIAPVVDDRIFCIRSGKSSQYARDYRLTVSDDYFESGDGVEPALEEGRAVSGIISMAAVKNYIVAAATSKGTDELALFVTKDSEQWHRAEFGQHRIAEESYTILESTNYSMQVDVLGSRRTNAIGHLFTSNSNGTYFTRTIDYTNRNIFGNVDFEKVSIVQGVYLVNTVRNWKEVQGSVSATKDVISQITFDDGRTFQDIVAGKDTLHLHSVTEARQMGRIFSSPAPGIVMGVGNTGKSLKAYDAGDLYVSDDTGLTWRKALSGAHLYEFGNQGAVLVAIDDEEPTGHLQYSLDHGNTWKKADLDKKIRAKFLTTVPDSTTLSFLVGGTVGSGSDGEWYISKVDFEGLHERACEKKDFEEEWPARVDEKGNPSCIMGHQQFYRRRKANADCVIEDEFKDPVPVFKPCSCTKADFECDYNFERSEDRERCLPVAPLPVPETACKDPGDTFQGPSGWRLIPGNACKGGDNLAEEVDRPCADTIKKPPTGEIAVEKTSFAADFFAEWYYLERGTTSLGDDESIVMRTSEQDIYLTKDHGKTWALILEGEPIVSIVPNPNFNDAIYFLTGSSKVFYTIDRGEHLVSFDAPKPPSKINLPKLKFHPGYRDWLLWSGDDKAASRTNIYYTKDRGDTWQTLVRGARRCDYIHRSDRDELIFCEQYQSEDPETKTLQLLSSTNFFADSTMHYPDILDFATMSEFIIVAQKIENESSLQVDASVDGQTFAVAQFPRNFQVQHQQAYTVMDSSTHAVFLHVTVNPFPDHEYGTIIKSNSNGTNYVKVLDNVNRDTPGYVDFEKMLGLEGVAMVNIVSNIEGVETGEKKKLKSMISHNDGSDWTWLPPPKKDADGRDYKCVGKDQVATDDCSLHIHSYTERRDKSTTFSSPTAVGLMMAVGNVGPYLERKDGENTDTFITSDAGITWKSVKKGSYMWEYGDQGSIIVIVPEGKPTRTVFYTLNEGDTWTEFEFSPGVDMEISAITTVPSDTSRNFLLWGREVGPGNTNGKVTTVSLDFSGLEERSRQCELDDTHPENSKDYYLWEPRHPFQSENCLFGHVAQYHRKDKTAACYNKPHIEAGPHKIVRNCTCSRQDFECDFNYQRNADGTCGLVPGYEQPDHQAETCKDPNADTWYVPTGYRRIPLSTCQGGQELDSIEPRPCPGKEKEFGEKHGSRLGGVALFFIVIISLAGAGGVGYWVWDQYNKRGGLSGMGFGQIHLGESLSSISGGPARSSSDSPFITIPVAIIAAIVAVGKTLPLVVTSLFRSAKGYMPLGSRGGTYSAGPYRTRDSFANRRQDFASPAFVEDDELLGDDDAEEEV